MPLEWSMCDFRKETVTDRAKERSSEEIRNKACPNSV